MLDWFVDIFTLEGLSHFVIGVGAASLWHLLKARLQGRIVVFKWQYISIPLAFLIVMHIALQTQQNADCVREFNQVLRLRSEVTSDNDRLSIQQRELIYDWIHNLVFPPPEIARLPGTDPKRERWAVDLTVQTDRKFRASIEQQRQNDAERAAHPLPEPTCGK